MVTTRKRAAPAAASAKKATATPKKPTAKLSTKKAPVEQESESESEPEPESEGEDEDEDNSPSEQEDDEEEEEEEEETFKIHTPKASSAPKVVPAALPTVTYEDDSEEEDSDAAPEAESLSSAKAKILSAQDKEKNFLSKVQAEQKAKRVEREQKLKEQKDLSKKKVVKVQDSARSKTDDNAAADQEPATTRSGLPTMLPMDILESVATMDDQESNAPGSVLNEKKRKHMRPEDFALMELEAELRAEAQKRKKAEKTQKNVGPVTVKVLDQSKLAKGHAVPETIVDFRKQHFYGAKIQRKDAVLNNSQRNAGAASKFNRRK
ncbi:hypothetical protein KVV02_004448 [Mortierella alpina]|uniref:Uncharacterized protein n=1 Tax=Mortierella alpina TaxID=64518 RepID=A0A9P8CXJ3_MORAP|nr:hypothetical protein KVV02_004448 [Mortierella alpina]